MYCQLHSRKAPSCPLDFFRTSLYSGNPTSAIAKLHSKIARFGFPGFLRTFFVATRLAGVFAGLLEATTAGAQSATNQEGTAASNPSPPPDSSAFAGKLTGGWKGARQSLADEGILPNGQLVLEGFENSQGGAHTGVAWASTFDLNVGVDLDKALNLKGGEFYMDLENHAGRDPAVDLTGDIQNFDKLNYRPYLQLFEFWYQQVLFDGRLRLKAGKIDANTEFSVIDNGLPFLNASTQVTPTITPFPTTPDPMPSADLFFTPVKAWYVDFMVSYANRSDTFGDITGNPESIQPTEYGLLFIGETGVRWDQAPWLERGGNLKAGVWGHNGTFTRFDGGQKKGSGGFYGILDQTFWQPAGEPADGRGVRGFMEGGQTQASVSVIDWNVAGGITWTGALARRADDLFGFSANYAHLSGQAGLPHPYELALEWFYQMPLTKWATVMPDFQFIIHPGGQYPNAAVGTLDLTIQF